MYLFYISLEGDANSSFILITANYYFFIYNALIYFFILTLIHNLSIIFISHIFYKISLHDIIKIFFSKFFFIFQFLFYFFLNFLWFHRFSLPLFVKNLYLCKSTKIQIIINYIQNHSNRSPFTKVRNSCSVSTK